MIKTFKNANKFVRDVIHPYILNLNTVLKEEFHYLNTRIIEIDDKLTSNIVSFNNRIYLLETDLRSQIASTLVTLSNQIATLAANINTHINRKDNPHTVKVSQTATISTLAPINTQGVTGDTWIRYHN